MLQENRPSCLPSKHEKMEQGGVVEETLKNISNQSFQEA